MPPVVHHASPGDALRIEQVRVTCWQWAYAHLLDPDRLGRLTVTEVRVSSWRESSTRLRAP